MALDTMKKLVKTVLPKPLADRLYHGIRRLALAATGPLAAGPSAMTARARRFADRWRPSASFASAPRVSREQANEDNPLWQFFDSRVDGPGIWKWEHYFPIYQRHLERFVGKPVAVMEVGIFSGGSLDLWRNYFGPGCHVYGIDIEESCRQFETEDVSVIIGDQGDPAFWDGLASQVPGIDVFIDDGSHQPAHQALTLEKVLPLLKPGGVFICEDIHRVTNPFNDYVAGLLASLNHVEADGISAFQSEVASIHCYPYCLVIEKRPETLTRLASARRGSRWTPFPGKPWSHVKAT